MSEDVVGFHSFELRDGQYSQADCVISEMTPAQLAQWNKERVCPHCGYYKGRQARAVPEE